MTDVTDATAARRRPVATRVAAVVVAVVTVVGTALTWSTTFSRGSGPTDRPAWASGAWPATGAALAVVGVVVLAAATFPARARLAPAVIGAVLAVAGVVTLLAERFRPVGLGELTPVTVAIGRFDAGPNPVVAVLPGAVAWVTAGGLGALVVVAAALPARSGRGAAAGGRGPRIGPAVGAVGAVLLLVGAGALPWTFGLPAASTVPLWGAGREAVTGAVLLVSAALVLAATAWWPVRGVAVTAALLAAGGLGVLLPQRLPNPWGDGFTGWYSYQPLDRVQLPPLWRFHAATTLVLLGAVLVLLGAVVATRARPGTARETPA